jgi:predicted NAD-dependent protein-ADP-ribosyltransferase YbiA (DUF1768 family)
VTYQPGTRVVNGRTPAYSGERAFLSNLFERPYVSKFFGIEVPSSEHDFNAQKSVEREHAEWILAAPTPADAKKRGNVRGRFTLRPGWDTGGRVRAMQYALLGKFDDPEMAALLAATGTEPLVETGYWHDVFWGGEGVLRPVEPLQARVLPARRQHARRTPDGAAHQDPGRPAASRVMTEPTMSAADVVRGLLAQDQPAVLRVMPRDMAAIKESLDAASIPYDDASTMGRDEFVSAARASRSRGRAVLVDQLPAGTEALWPITVTDVYAPFWDLTDRPSSEETS